MACECYRIVTDKGTFLWYSASGKLAVVYTLQRVLGHSNVRLIRIEEVNTPSELRGEEIPN